MPKVILITGTSTGLGVATAVQAAQAGHTVYATMRNTQKRGTLDAAAQVAGVSLNVLQLDVQDTGSVNAAVDTVITEQGRIDVLINNAGVEAGAKTYQTTEEEDWDYVIDTNLKSAWMISKRYTERVLEHKQQSGNIIMVSSITDSRTIKGQFSYAVSKGGMTRMTEVMALEAAKFNIRVNALAPGYFLTDLSRLLLESDIADEFTKGIPMRRTGEFPDLDGPLLLLASDASRYMTGSILVVDGGHICASL